MMLGERDWGDGSVGKNTSLHTPGHPSLSPRTQSKPDGVVRICKPGALTVRQGTGQSPRSSQPSRSGGHGK